MIIQCKNCGTKYRFDESLIVRDGVWVRCSRCKETFFQEPLSKEEEVSLPEVMEAEEGAVKGEIEKEISDLEKLLEEAEGVTKQEIEIEVEKEEEVPPPEVTEEEEAVSAEAEEETAEQEIEVEKEKAVSPLDMMEEKEIVGAETEEEIAEEEIKEEIEVEKEEAPPSEVMEEEEAVGAGAEEETSEQEIEVEKEVEEEEKTTVEKIEEELPDIDELLEKAEEVGKEPFFPSDEEIAEEKEREKEKKKKKRLWTPGKVFIYILIVILVLGGVYLWLFPEMREHILDRVSHYMSTGKLKESFGTGDKSVSKKVGGVDFINVKERFLKNWIFGDILVVQGTIVNKCDYPISRIKVCGKLLDASEKVLDEVEFYCGNLLTDEELSNLTKKEITGELSIPLGSEVSNNNIDTGGKIPFMIVFANPSKEAEELIVELAGNTRPSK
ncbi:MAG: zinc-ribbon domain-containing protein [Proteobacteria bacterium]|nr:zinc-ribbon domain-containing protein [Pseudomonadota bacterium]